MAITYIGGVSEARIGSGADLVLAQPTHEADDFGLLFIVNENDQREQTVTTAGWSLLRDDAETAGFNRRSFIYYKKYDSNSEPDPVIAINSPANKSAQLALFRGVDPVTPFDVTETYGSGTNTPNPTHQPITTVTDGCCFMLMNYPTHDDIVVQGSPMTPDGLILSPQNIVGFQHGQNLIAYKPDVGLAGAYTPSAWMHVTNASSAEYNAYTLALRPAVGDVVGKVYSGAAAVNQVYAGSVPVNKIYIGSSLVFDKT